ncbi:dolichyl-P-Man:Man(5)GlcNAc(2)-PP-dolichol alpha-1,3-mannosyltransferase [Scheffersomyces spartinae]|uniref:Dol-P-Man:Man(5)GlcNAc(2)-PP-Dol alpha-1,3-mannosyltransferase n=1 Tax=Scheffersomyces spartinae TaxID=45513 RepID=A0A9P7VBM5_9ASCO|nr:dolichyl-P-Man:Man(5)GlcNAc(2)-PP-dolichol alpha-1,3-mannosyltransferase [Scheffersomyces spartinae]KAG7195053.1 dolichyl-P-Man:Man(5)GlcNAc(2)-PP-dolichol alpha-1,3-mannosyltransferase [Scheffersomyces spartinae]
MAPTINDKDDHLVLANETLASPELPEFTFRNVMGDIKYLIQVLINDPFYKRLVGPIIVFLMSILSRIVITMIPYTEIDFSTYMQQIQLVKDGELDYSLIRGDTGPVVYPAGFITVYEWIYDFTGQGTQLAAGQSLFSMVLTATTLLTVVVYCLIVDMPPWPLLMLVLSKRLISIYVLRLFNDVFTTICMIGVTLLLQLASYTYSILSTYLFVLCGVAADLYSLAISVKMNALLYLPGFIFVCYFLLGENLIKLLLVLLIIPLIQVLVGWKFLIPLYHDEEAKYLRYQYLSNAFDFSRTFLYKWTVNWRFLSEQVFLSKTFHKSLLFLHGVVLLCFVVFKFTKKHMIGKSFKHLIGDFFAIHKSTVNPQNILINQRLGPKYVFLILAISNVVGILCSRSLHYQFLSWYYWQLPALLWFAGFNVYVATVVLLIHEYTWNVYPSTELSSALLVSVLTLVLTGIFINSLLWHPDKEQDDRDHKKKNE